MLLGAAGAAAEDHDLAALPDAQLALEARPLLPVLGLAECVELLNIVRPPQGLGYSWGGQTQNALGGEPRGDYRSPGGSPRPLWLPVDLPGGAGSERGNAVGFGPQVARPLLREGQVLAGPLPPHLRRVKLQRKGGRRPITGVSSVHNAGSLGVPFFRAFELERQEEGVDFFGALDLLARRQGLLSTSSLSFQTRVMVPGQLLGDI